jgi:hypothetical protein
MATRGLNIGMRPAKTTGRTIGLLLFAQLVGLSLPFILLMPGTTAGFLENAAGLAAQIKLAVLLLFVNAALTIAISLVAFPLIRTYSEALALSFLALSVIWFAIQAVDNAHILSMLSLSQQYADGGASNAELFATLGSAIRSTRRWLHYTELLVIDAWFLLLNGVLFRFALVPRLFSGFGIAMVVVHTTAITLPVFVGYRSVQVLGFSLAVSHLALASWLVSKGIPERTRESHLEPTA